MILSHENPARVRLSLSVEEALQLQRELATQIGLALRNVHASATGSMPVVERIGEKAYPRVLLVTINAKEQS